MLGICNGFQILLEAGLLPGAMLRNRGLKFRCEHVHVRVEQTDTPFTAAVRAGQVLRDADRARRGQLLRDRRTCSRGSRRTGRWCSGTPTPAGDVDDDCEPERIGQRTSPASATRRATSSA